MNNARRKQIDAIISKMEESKSELENLLEEEQEAYDNMPDSLQDSERGEKAQEAISNLEDAISGIDDVLVNLEESRQ